MAIKKKKKKPDWYLQEPGAAPTLPTALTANIKARGRLSGEQLGRREPSAVVVSRYRHPHER